jgi:hypothetical protein
MLIYSYFIKVLILSQRIGDDCLAIKPICDSCGKELDRFGGLLLSPPDSKNRVRKYHLCVKCFNSITKGFDR